MTGLMWFSQYAPNGQLAIRHTCEQSDGLRKYGWLKHDGTNFGSQQIVDKDFVLTTDFVKKLGGDHGGDWTAKISGKEMVGGFKSISIFEGFSKVNLVRNSKLMPFCKILKNEALYT